MATANYDRSRGNTGRTTGGSMGNTLTSRPGSGSGSSDYSGGSWQATKDRLNAAAALKAAPKYTPTNNPSALSNQAAQNRLDEQQSRGDTGEKIFKAVGNMLPIPLAGQALGWAGRKVGENLPEGPLKSNNEFASRDGSGNWQDRSAGGSITGATGIGGQFGGTPEPAFDGTMQPGSLQPWQRSGTAALDRQNALLGMGTPEEQAAAFKSFGDSPGQKFLRDRAEKSLMRNAPAMGGQGGGNVRSALNEQAVGFAAQDYDNYYNRLGKMSGQGFQATTAGLDENFRNTLNAQQLSQMSQQKKAGQTENILNLVGQFEEPIGDMFSSIGDSVSDWLEW